MPQYFLKGWISAYPGEGLMKFTLPVGTTNVKWNIHVQDIEDYDLIVIEHGYTGDTQPTEFTTGETGHAWVKWNNQKDGDIFFDYEITPLYSSPVEDEPVALETEG